MRVVQGAMSRSSSPSGSGGSGWADDDNHSNKQAPDDVDDAPEKRVRNASPERERKSRTRADESGR